MYNDMMGMGEKTPKKYMYKKNKEKFPVWFPSRPPSIKLEADCFPGRKNRKQAGPTLGWAGIQSTKIKEINGRARYGSIKAGNMIFLHMNIQDLQ